MAHIFQGAHNVFVKKSQFKVRYAPNYYIFNLILFATMGGNPPANIPQAGQTEDRGHTPSFAILSLQQQVVHRYSIIVGGVLVGVTSVVFNCRPSSTPPSLPAAVPIYGRDEFIQMAVEKILVQGSEVEKHIALRGGPGMGKTTIATGIIHHPRIARHFGKARHWVSCREASDIADDLKAHKLLEYISESLDLDLSGSGDHRKNIKHFLNHNNIPRVIVLDNFETMWEPLIAQEASEGVLAYLASFPQLTILLTTRNAHHPATHRGVSWHQFESIQPLSLDASRTLFTSRCLDTTTIDSRLDDLLRAVDCIPLPIVLMASYGQENFTTSEILDKWNSRLSQRIEIQPHDGDPMNKLDLSIAMSLEGPLIKSSPEAPVLLRIMAGLPGAIRRKNLKGIVPLIHNVDRVAAVLVRTSLLMNSRDVWQMHSTIRSYMLHHHSLDASHQENVQEFYFQLIHEAGHDPGTLDFLERARRLSHEETNAQALLIDALEHNFSVTSVSISTDYTNYLVWNIPSIDIAKKTVEMIRNQSSPTTDSLLPLPLLRLGALYLRLDNYPEAIEALEEAVVWFQKLDQMKGAAKSWALLASIYRLRSEYTRAFELYSLAYRQFEDMKDARGMSTCLLGKGISYFENDRYSDAVEIDMDARNTCLPDDHNCIADSDRELGRVYRVRNTTESIRLSTNARDHYLIHGPQFFAALALYQKSIALYSQENYGEAEVGLNEAYEEFRSLRNDAQMAYSIYHLAKMNRMRGSLRKALDLYNRSGTMFKHMGNNEPKVVRNDTGKSRMGNEFMVAISLERQAELYARLCRQDEAKAAHSSAHALLENIGGREMAAMHCRLVIQNIPDMCEPVLWRDVTFQFLTLFLACAVLFSLLIRRRRFQFFATP